MIEKNHNFCAKKFVHCLLNEGDDFYCDDFVEPQENLPEFFDEAKLKRGQAFYWKNFAAVFFSMMLGVICTFSLEHTRKILKFTKQSDNPSVAYRRYTTTILYLHLWQSGSFKPGTKLWKSLHKIRCVHARRSWDHSKAGGTRISQTEMALTQLAFIGFIVTRPEKIGIHWVKPAELAGFVHLWRNIGRVLGMSDRYNICRESLEETKEICEELIDKTFRVKVDETHEDFLDMTKTVVGGIKFMILPVMDANAYVLYLRFVLNARGGQRRINEKDNAKQISLTFYQKFCFSLMKVFVYTLKYDVARYFQNFMTYLHVILIPKYCPVLAILAYGRKYASIKI